jgi:predicted MPP superfamily phosphohydrolase
VSTTRNLLAAAGTLALTGTAVAGWSLFVEPNWFRIRRYELPLLPAGFTGTDGTGTVRILHISDQHQTTWQHWKPRWILGLADELDPHLVVNTGDNFGGQTLDMVLDSHARLLERPGAFVLGSNDYFAPHFKNPLKYLDGPSNKRSKYPAVPDLPVEAFVGAYRDAGWNRLDNAAALVMANGARIAMSGLGDAHIALDADHAPAFAPDADVRIGVTHAPYQRALAKLSAVGSQLILAGHTHGGQVCIPFWGAPATNCDQPRDRARGLFRCLDSWVEVSGGTGVSALTPVRFACRPEASLITLTTAG